MSIRDRAFYHGAALAGITDHDEFTAINRVPNLDSPSAYIINNNIGIYIKHSTAIDTPWRFTFSPEHQNDVRRLYDQFREHTHLIFVCGTDGFCLVDYGTFSACLDMNHRENEWLEITRINGGRYRIRGAQAIGDRTIPMNAFPQRLFN